MKYVKRVACKLEVVVSVLSALVRDALVVSAKEQVGEEKVAGG